MSGRSAAYVVYRDDEANPLRCVADAGKRPFGNADEQKLSVDRAIETTSVPTKSSWTGGVG